MKAKLKAHIVTLPRWFAIPFFGASILMGAVLAGGIDGNAWIGLVAGILVMAGGHALNSWGDWVTGLDQGEAEDRSAEKDYTGGQNLIAAGIVSLRETLLNGLAWYALSAIPVIYLALNTGWPIIILWILGMGITFWYSLVAKFNWTHELALGVGVGPLALLLGMFSVNANADWGIGLLVSAPFAIILSFLGLALDEYPDAEANLKKGVKSIAYKVWEYGVSLEWYVSTWLLALFVYQVFLITIGVLAPLTGLTFIILPLLIMLFVVMKANFRKVMGIIVPVAALYPILLLIGQAVGG